MDWDAWFQETAQDETLTEKQKQIMIAAIEMFSEKGYASSSTSEIARRAGVAEGTIFRHYKTKEKLLQAIVEPVIRQIIAPFIIGDLNKVLNRRYEHFEDFVRSMIENRRKFLERHFSLIKIVFQEIPFHPQLQQLFKKHVAPAPLAKIRGIIVHFQEKGELIQGSPYTIMRLAASSGAGYLLARQWLRSELNWDDEEEREATIRYILKGLSPDAPPS
ncbi:MAG TPA: TetR/AcrR family transcriptional regulator [Bacillales bacterium]|nr:TetR/AcrR family transcriptional regulator [Bacillales bacterium]